MSTIIEKCGVFLDIFHRKDTFASDRAFCYHKVYHRFFVTQVFFPSIVVVVFVFVFVQMWSKKAPLTRPYNKSQAP
jgi:hypothetical protein